MPTPLSPPSHHTPSASKTHSPLVEGLLFLLTGFGITALNALLYMLMVSWLKITPPLAATLAFVIMTPPHFLTYAKVVFKSDYSAATFLRYGLMIAVSFFFNVWVLSFFWAYLLADPLPALILGLTLAILSNYLLLKFFVFGHRLNISPDTRSQAALNFVTLVFAGLAIYVAMSAILLYTTSELFADDWRHYRDYFFDKSYLASMLDRQNGHLMILPNIAFLHNYLWFGGQMSNLAILNVGALSFGGLCVGYVLFTIAKSEGWGLTTQLAASIAGGAIIFTLSAPNVLFWGIPLHNQGVMAATLASAVFASGLLGDMKKPTIFIGWLFFTLIAATTFSTGAAAGALGIIGAVLNRASWRVCALYFISGLSISVLSIGLLTSSRSGTDITALFDLPQLLGFLLAHIGNPLSILHAKAAPDVTLKTAQMWGGFASVLALPLIALTLKTWSRAPSVSRRPCDHALIYVILILAFSVLTGVLIYLGRNQSSGMNVALSPRFATWGSLFWFALTVGYISVSLRLHTARWGRVTPFFICGVAVLILCINIWVIDNRVRYGVNFHQDRITQIAINGGERNTRVNLWRKNSDVPRRVSADLKQRGWNLYAHDWIHRQNQPLDLDTEVVARTCGGSFTLKATSRSDEFIVKGWAFRTNEQRGTLHHIYVIDNQGRVIGHARPAYAPVIRNSVTYSEARPFIFKAIHALRWPVITDAPGLSGRFLGNARTEITDIKSLNFVGEDAYGQLCRVE